MWLKGKYMAGGARRGATAAAVGPGGEGGEAPKDFTKPRQTIQSPDKPYKAPTDYTKPPKDYRKSKNIKQNPKILDKHRTH